MTEQEQQVQTIPVELPLEGWNVVVEALAQLPYAKVYQVVGSLHQQVQAQTQPQMPMEFPEPEVEAE